MYTLRSRTFPSLPPSPLCLFAFTRFHPFLLTAFHSSITALLKLYPAVSTLTELIKYRSISLRTFQRRKVFFFDSYLLGKDNHVPFHLLTLLSTFLPFRSFCHFFSSPSSCYSLNSPTKNDILNISRTTILEGKKHNFYL